MANKKCPVAKKCSGCQLSNMTYEQQLEWKQKDTEKLLGSFGKVSKIIGADDPYNYRNKVQAVFRSDRNGRIISGVYQSSRNGIVGIDSCMLDDKRADEIIVGIRGLLATVYKGNIIKNLIMDCQSYTKYRPNETTGGIFVSWRRKEELPTGA